jgi:dihydropyrimidine dehydrogenase (NAD+) subunit PreA
MEQVPAGQVDARTGKKVEKRYGNWTEHPNNPSVVAAE